MFGFEMRESFDLDCFFILPNGKYLVCEYNKEHKQRITTHFELFVSMGDIFDPSNNEEWIRKQKEYQLIRLVPECNFMLLSDEQKITPEQELVISELISKHNFEIHNYEILV